LGDSTAKELTMLRKVLFTAVLAATAAASQQAGAIGRLADVTITDRSTGQVLPVHYYKGEYWVAGTPGAKYSISVGNQSGGRVLAVMSVDGVNVLNGQTASFDQSGYVFNAGQRYDINGWRKSNYEVAAFEFVASPASYAERTGRPANVGVIGVALFRERYVQPPISIAPPPVRYPFGGRDASEERLKAGVAETENAAGSLGRAAASAQPAPPAPAAPAAPAAEYAKRAEAQDRRADTMREKLGTGHGERESSYVSNTQFERAQSTPNETISIRYDSRENLVAMGVIPSRHPGRGQPRPFPDSYGFVPDPPRYR